jgi:hypothetical protein
LPPAFGLLPRPERVPDVEPPERGPLRSRGQGAEEDHDGSEGAEGPTGDHGITLSDFGKPVNTIGPILSRARKKLRKDVKSPPPMQRNIEPKG